MNALSVKNLSKTYANFKLDNISFEVKNNHIVGLIGRNGAGKSTTIKGIMNFISKTGEIKIFNKEFLDNEQQIKQEIGYVGGGFKFYQFKTLKKLAKIYSMFYTNWDNQKFSKYLKIFNLDENKKIKELSSGMQVKFAIALSLSHNAKFIIMDEPTSGLDPISRDEFCDIVLELAKQGVSILFSTHITSDLMKVADDIVYISNGKILVNCTIDELLNKYYLVHFSSIKQTKDIKIIGLKETKKGYEGLILKNNLSTNIKYENATLDNIMIHLEKEQNNEKFN